MSQYCGLLWTLLLLPCAACGTPEFRATKAPGEPLNGFLQVEVSPIRLDFPGQQDAEVLDDARMIAETLLTRLTHRLAKSKLFDHPGRKLIVQGRMVGFEPGSQAARYFIGFGAGKGTLDVEVSLLDEAGSLVAQGTVSADVWCGLFGGSVKGLGKDVADSVFAFIRTHYKEVPKVQGPPTE